LRDTFRSSQRGPGARASPGGMLRRRASSTPDPGRPDRGPFVPTQPRFQFQSSPNVFLWRRVRPNPLTPESNHLHTPPLTTLTSASLTNFYFNPNLLRTRPSPVADRPGPRLPNPIHAHPRPTHGHPPSARPWESSTWVRASSTRPAAMHSGTSSVCSASSRPPGGARCGGTPLRDT